MCSFSNKGITEAFFLTLNILLINVCSNFVSSLSASSFTTRAFRPVNRVGLIYVFQIDLFNDKLFGSFVVNLYPNIVSSFVITFFILALTFTISVLLLS